MTAKIMPLGELHKEVLRRPITTKLTNGTVGKAHIFMIANSGGLATVISYVNHPDGEMTEVRTVHGKYFYWRWYDHGVITTRQAALLVNRFMQEISQDTHP